MRAFSVGLIAVLALSLSSLGQVDVLPDSEAYLRAKFRFLTLEQEDFVFIGNDDRHFVRLVWKWEEWWALRRIVWRSYIHFDKADLPDCFTEARLRLRFETVVGEKSVSVTVAAVDWDGVTPLGWYSQPSPYWSTTISVTSPGWQTVDVTDAVNEAVDQGYELAFMVRLTNELPDWWSAAGRREATFVHPRLRFTGCNLEIKVEGLDDATVCQAPGPAGCDAYVATSRYAPLGELAVKVSADIPYEVRACYEVDPTPSPPFTADPVELAYTWSWITVPACPSYTILPGFSGNPGDEAHTYRVRVDLADLGDRAAGERFKFVINVWVVPQ